ncbi:MAG: DUF4058 family protein [Gemmataceae bacterium]
MPIHDWTRVPSGLFHDFHQRWAAAICNALNTGAMPDDYYAYVEQKLGGPEPDVIAVESASKNSKNGLHGGTALLEAPKTRVVHRLESDAVLYARKADRVVIRHHLGEAVAIIEIVSPGNKESRSHFREFLDKTTSFIRSGIHVLIVDLFPPTKRDPRGVHRAILDEFGSRPFAPPRGKPLTLAAYRAAPPLTAYVEPVAVGDAMPNMPLFITKDAHVPVPLEETYMANWKATGKPLRDMLTS